MSDDVRHDGYDDWLDPLETDQAFYLECSAGHGSLPPRRVCPECGSGDLSKTALPTAGELDTFTVTHVPTPAFADDAPYATGIVDFGPIRVTGRVLELDPDEIEPGLTVEATVIETDTTGERLVGFRPR
ncbi:putative nucleic-acid-binding protein containing a Zn-ribbon [Halovivax ruber XH-70]|uniref:Putative nucleic-acid-binding protein containing a Zn-ribbon n=1 Tax=Halovivax ruber (strain DSM 18193 / JCM 13892 / XH-70) TaxID=797302 RepID=L0ICM0_HALRX|nr:OB-fold domain-containing protein [Halovivax ruber]AGB15712.1 putative nucleic-acid-binding protein containing a Zn-ribbon [Halovivax ruber XH-70]